MTIVTQQEGQFTGYTLSELRSLVLRMLRVTDTKRYSPTGGSADYDWIDDSLNRGQEDFVRVTKCLQTYAIIEMKANYRTYRFPWNFLDLESAYFVDSSLANGYRKLEITSHNAMDIDIGDWRTASGTPNRIYMDRVLGNTRMFGLYPAPSSDGGTISFDSEYGVVVDWACPVFEFSAEYGVIIRMSDADEYIMNMDTGVVAQATEMNNNVILEYYRLPENLIVPAEHLGTIGAQYPEIPREYQKALTYFAVSDLLQNNPEDSAEFKRAQSFEKRFASEMKTYNAKRKKPLDGRMFQRKAAVWGWQRNMQYNKDLP